MLYIYFKVEKVHKIIWYHFCRDEKSQYNFIEIIFRPADEIVYFMSKAINVRSIYGDCIDDKWAFLINDDYVENYKIR